MTTQNTATSCPRCEHPLPRHYSPACANCGLDLEIWTPAQAACLDESDDKKAAHSGGLKYFNKLNWNVYYD